MIGLRPLNPFTQLAYILDQECRQFKTNIQILTVTITILLLHPILGYRLHQRWEASELTAL